MPGSLSSPLKGTFLSFDSPLFLIMALLVFVLARLWPFASGAILLSGSLVFYAFAGWFDVGLVAFTVLLNFAFSFPVARDRRWLPVIVLLDLAILAFFKYRYLLFPSLAAQTSDFFEGEILIPLGISFYVFQIIAYQVDLARGHTSHIRSLWHFALFILLFVQMVAGPIMRANVLEPQIVRSFSGHLPKRRIWVFGLGLCLIGLIKKVALADSLAPHVDALFAQGPADVFSAWLGAILFAFQIYFDFSGYSDIAVGLGYLLGFRIPFNFRQPYLAMGPREFWQRWHITLSTWIRDYIYIPLGGSHVGGQLRQAAVLLLTMGLAGAWHGANWTFVIWGMCWGAYIMVWRILEQPLAALGRGRWIVHIVAVLVLWVFFRSPSLDSALTYLAAMFGDASGLLSVASGGMEQLLILAGVALLAFTHRAEAWLMDMRHLGFLRRHDGPFLQGVILGLCIWLVINPKPLANPFIYFRF